MIWANLAISVPWPDPIKLTGPGEIHGVRPMSRLGLIAKRRRGPARARLGGSVPARAAGGLRARPVTGVHRLESGLGRV
jgi:hypothetical protein